jgi:hypothetical protein
MPSTIDVHTPTHQCAFNTLRRPQRGLFGAKGVLRLLLALFLATTARAQINVLTYHGDNARTGQNLTETILTPQNVNSTQFGKLFALTTDGQVYAQPLYMANVAIPGKGTHNVLFVATEGDTVYAFDADNNTGANASPLWKASLVDATHGATAGEAPLNTGATIGCTDLQPQIGITSTPVIDPASGTIYVEAKSVIGSTYIHRLHALDITTGNEKAPGPVQINATVPGTGDGSSGGNLPFDSLHQMNRPGLLLMNGTIFIAYASHCDFGPYHGWLFAYDRGTLAQRAVYNTTNNGGLGGIWMSGSGVAADGNGNMYVATGNGTFSQTPLPLQLGDSILKLNFSNGTLSLTDYFTPFNQSNLNGGDTDLGSGGVLLLPDQPGAHPHLLIEAGKEGRIYLIDRDTITNGNQHYCNGCANDPEIVQESGGGQVGGMWAMPAYWNGSTYWWGSGDVLKAIPLANGLLDFAHQTMSSGPYGFPGATPAISANGNTNGIVWSIDSSQYGSPGPGPGPAVLHAHDASNVSKELYNSTQAQSPVNRDRAGNAVKFSVPIIANGKVYVGATNEVDVYGILNGGTPAGAIPQISPGSESVSGPVQVKITDSSAGASIIYTTDGSTPTATHGATYTSQFTVNSTTTVKAIATGGGFTTSGIATAVYTIQLNPISSVNEQNGFTASGLALMGSAAINGTRLRLTDTGANEAGSGFWSTPLNIQKFTTDFSFQLTTANADGFTFTIHGGSAPGALGPAGGGLGYGPDTTTGPPGIPTSVAVKLDLYSNAGEGTNSTGIYTNGASPTVPFVDLTGTGIDLHSGDIFQVHMSYDGTNLAMTITDTVTQAAFNHTFPINIPATVGGNTAFVGFTGGTGGLTAIQEILNWTYVSGPAAMQQVATPTFTPPAGTYTTPQSIHILDSTSGAAIFYTTDGSNPTPSSTKYNAPFTLSSSATVKAIATATGFANSNVATAVYTISNSTPIMYETEKSPAVSSGPVHRIFNWAGFTDGVGTILDATKVGDNVTYTLNIAKTGKYDVRVGVKKFPTRGIWQLSVNGANVGPTQDEYSASETFAEFDLGAVTITAAGNNQFKFTVVGHNAGSSGFTMAFDYIKLTPQ